ncbi:DUF3037 domain-containing protein [Mobilicoccus pelagius]|uniref:DUF3037 domain-containing protein n=1 Tax=Mobilicoccus pelagius NBRC 104925 TaxID=1089455 RepID=H5UTI6_9MICO|nr:DUF3037 domain-containing protein [Mobilicoccus pelagius]GAB49044.1 hypothetical protein MOPEL_096_00510 [Mobilicoccus pelagius NBRC 104925]
MSDLLPYQYVTLRCVPRVEREEFVNVGVVLFCQEADVLVSGHALCPERLLALDPDLDLKALRASLRQVEAVCRGEAGRTDLTRQGARFGWIAAPRSTVVQPGSRHGGLTTDPVAELDRLLARLVLPAPSNAPPAAVSVET